MIKPIIYSVLFIVFSVPARAQSNKSLIKNYQHIEKAIRPKCLNATEYAHFKKCVLAIFSKNEVWTQESPNQEIERSECFKHANGHLISFQSNAGGTLAATESHFVLVTAKGAQEVFLNEQAAPLTKDLKYIQRPYVTKVAGKAIIVKAEGFREDDANCCAGYDMTYEYRLAGNRLVPVKIVSMKKEPKQP